MEIFYKAVAIPETSVNKTIEDYIEEQFNIVISKPVLDTNERKGFSKETGKFYTVYVQDFESENSARIQEFVNLFKKMSELKCKQFHFYDKLIISRSQDKKLTKVLLITELLEGTNVNDMISHIGDNIAELHHIAVTNCLESFYKFVPNIIPYITDKPVSILQKQCEIKCFFKIFENFMFNDPDQLSKRIQEIELDSKNSRTLSYPSYLSENIPEELYLAKKIYRKWFDDQEMLEHKYKDIIHIGEGGFGTIFKVYANFSQIQVIFFYILGER